MCCGVFVGVPVQGTVRGRGSMTIRAKLCKSLVQNARAPAEDWFIGITAIISDCLSEEKGSTPL